MKVKLKVVSQIVIVVVGFILLGISIFGQTQSNWALCGALGCLISANVLNILRIKQRRNPK